MAYPEYRYMDTGGLESDKRKLEAYLRYCEVDAIRDQCNARILAITDEIDLRSETEIYNGHTMPWKQKELF